MLPDNTNGCLTGPAFVAQALQFCQDRWLVPECGAGRSAADDEGELTAWRVRYEMREDLVERAAHELFVQLAQLARDAGRAIAQQYVEWNQYLIIDWQPGSGPVTQVRLPLDYLNDQYREQKGLSHVQLSSAVAAG